MKIIIIYLILLMIFLSGCSSEGYIPKDNTVYHGEIRTDYLCEDRVVCYYVITGGGYGAAGSCFRDDDLINKYCRE
jgi:hypothetical protein